jgi:H+/gluconate symporter-like permease
VAPVFSGIFMDKMVGFVKLYFPVFLLGAVFGKLIELSGFSESIVVAAIKYIGRTRANAVIVLVCALLTYGGCRCSWWCLPSIRLRPSFTARATFPSA